MLNIQKKNDRNFENVLAVLHFIWPDVTYFSTDAHGMPKEKVHG